MSASKSVVIQAHPHHVEIKLDNHTLAESDRSLLLIESYAPDIYLPFDDVRMEHMSKTVRRTHCPHKGEASYWTASAGNVVAENAMWAYENPIPTCAEIAGHAAFYCSAVATYIDGRLMRGHARDPRKTITTEPLGRRLVAEFGGQVIVDTRDCLLLRETGLPARHYVPTVDVSARHLVPSSRRSVCAYKGEAVYHHVDVGNRRAENAVWSYPRPWLDFSGDLVKVRGYLAFYASAFDRVRVDGEPLELDAATRATDAHMLTHPTVDRALQDKIAAGGQG